MPVPDPTLNLDPTPQTLDFKVKEISLRLDELRLEAATAKEAKKPDNKVLYVAIISGVLTVLSTVLGGLIQSNQAHQAAADTFRSNLLLKITEEPDPAKRNQNILYYLKAGILPDPDNKIKNLLPENTALPEYVPQTPAAVAAPSNSITVDNLIFSNPRGAYSHVGSAIVIRSGFIPDPDGSPHAYGPDDSKALDDKRNTGSPGNWVGLVTDKNGNPVMQGNDDPAPGYYISQTPLIDVGRIETDPRRYVDSETVNYIVIPSNMGGKPGEPCLGDIAAVYCTKTGKTCYGVVADFGSPSLIGAGSLALAKNLGVPDRPRKGSVENGIVMVVFPNSGQKPNWPLSNDEIDKQGTDLFAKWGGLKRLNLESPTSP